MLDQAVEKLKGKQKGTFKKLIVSYYTNFFRISLKKRSMEKD